LQAGVGGKGVSRSIKTGPGNWTKRGGDTKSKRKDEVVHCTEKEKGGRKSFRWPWGTNPTGIQKGKWGGGNLYPNSKKGMGEYLRAENRESFARKLKGPGRERHQNTWV